MDLFQLLTECATLLEVSRFEDYCPNGLQVEGRRNVQRLVTGVTASQALIEAAINEGADALLVHHGLFWNGDAPCLRGPKAKRVAALLRNELSLLAYHLPLDAHPCLGNNAQLAQVLGFQHAVPVATGKGLIWQGELAHPISLATLAQRVTQLLHRPPLALSGGTHAIQRIAWCSGAAQGYLEQAAALGADAYLSGEVSEFCLHQARELGMHYLAAGHHATERYGVQALGTYLAQQYDLVHIYLEIDNPI